MASEARRRHPELALVVGDGRHVPLAGASVDVVRADRVLQHLDDGAAALREWRRILRPDGLVITFDPDVTLTHLEGTDPALTERVLSWRASTRAGAATVHAIDHVLSDTGFRGVQVERRVLDVSSLDQVDGIMGLIDWADQAALGRAVTVAEAGEWREQVRSANADGSLRFRCPYLLCVGRAAIPRHR
jgi:SAM-dependent methyltransferase